MIHTKVDLAVYYLIALSPVPLKKLALSTHENVLLQMRLSFDITLASGYFQEIMDQLISGMNRVVVYIDDILIIYTLKTNIDFYRD